MPEYTFDPRLIELVDIASIEHIEHVNGVDIAVQDDFTFLLGSGIISHNSAAKSIQGGRGDNPYIGSFALKGKPSNVRDKDVIKVLGLDKDKKTKDGKAVQNEIQKILSILGLKIGTSVDTIQMNDGEWVEVEVDGKTMIVNENDVIETSAGAVRVSSLL